MLKPRECAFGISLGDIGMGKSEQTLIQGLRYVKKGQKALWADVQGEYGDYILKSIPGKEIQINIRRLAIKDVPIFTRQTVNEARRIIFLTDDGLPMSPDEAADAIYQILRYYKDGLFVLEDLRTIIGSTLPKDLLSRILSLRHSSVDIIANFQSVNYIKASGIWSRITWIRMHKYFDSVDTCREEFAGHWELMKIAEILVNQQFQQGNTRFFCWIYRRERKIKGAFSKEAFVSAVERYINTQYRKVMRDYIEERDNNGKPVFKHDEAFKKVRQELYETYFGNNN